MTLPRSTLPHVSFDPTDAAFVQNPYPAYRNMRAAGDVIFWVDYDLPVAVTSAAVTEAMRHPKMGRAVPGDPPATSDDLRPFYEIEEHSLLEIEPPDHTRVRKIVARAFAGKRTVVLAPLVNKIAYELIDQFPTDASFDLLQAYAQTLTARVIAAFLGINEQHASQLRAWSNAMVAMYQARRDAQIERAAATAAKQFAEFVTAELDRRKHLPQGDFLTDLVLAESARELTRPEAISTAILLLNAGQEATAHSIGNAVRTLVGYSDIALALQPEHIAGTVEECLRFTPPLHMFMRHAYEPVTLAGLDFPEGTQIACLLGSACRDDAVWPDGELFDPFRVRRPHQSFGVGIHACTGAALARLEMQIALPALFSRCAKLEITSPPRIANKYHFHGLESLQVRLAGPGST
ncbi:MAG: cytochrome P450 [Pseudomonadota bacterium]